ncbi:MAG: orotidine-5'-phosphate decarboxylase [Bacteroidetes bacterium]|nr:orotidine-5'-phosphate decarboxylase [Bacteroidota bacterium]
MNKRELVQQIFAKKSFLCVGLDPELSKIPAHLHQDPDPVFAFNAALIDATRDLCVAYKPNLAFFEALGPKGWLSFQKTVEYIGKEHLIIADAKRGDIGNTSRMYATAFFEQYHCDAITVAPYMGSDSVQPFFDFPDKWVVLLALTSNPGSADFQNTLQSPEQLLLFEKVLQKAQSWGSPENLMFVVGATHPEAFAQVRAQAPEHFLLVPGVGAQGGDLQAVCRHGMNADIGLLINASRAIIYAGSNVDFADKARAAALDLQIQMADIIQNR